MEKIFFECKYEYAVFLIYANDLEEAKEEALFYFISLFGKVKLSEIEIKELQNLENQ